LTPVSAKHLVNGNPWYFPNVSLALQLELLKLIKFTDPNSDKNDNVFGVSFLSLS
tara:strand:+ start:95 stop:259 length:165 start_codon:yes stop_codon:yes gene_type:complete